MSDQPITFSHPELYQRLVAYISNGYKELDHYEIELTEDIISTGIHRFQLKITQARGWANRVLGMLREAKRWQNQTNSIADGKKLRFERLVSTHIRDTAWPKGVGADERRSQAELQYQTDQDELHQWQDMTAEMRAFVDACQQKHKDLINSKDDLKALLWTVRLQLVLDSKDVSIQPQELQSRAAKPLFENGDEDNLTTITPAGNTIDELLQK